MQKAVTCLLPSDLLLFKCVAKAYMGVCLCVRIIVAYQPNRQPLNLKFRLWLLSELIYMPLMSPPVHALHSVLRQRQPPCSQKFRETRSSKGLSVF